jgi:hypothetical protein
VPAIGQARSCGATVPGDSCKRILVLRAQPASPFDDTHVHWLAEIWGKDVEWDAEITEQIPDRRISWKSDSGSPNAGTVRFEPMGSDRSLVRLRLPSSFATLPGRRHLLGDAVDIAPPNRISRPATATTSRSGKIRFSFATAAPSVRRSSSGTITAPMQR